MAERSCKRSTRIPDLDNASGGTLHTSINILPTARMFFILRADPKGFFRTFFDETRLLSKPPCQKSLD